MKQNSAARRAIAPIFIVGLLTGCGLADHQEIATSNRSSIGSTDLSTPASQSSGSSAPISLERRGSNRGPSLTPEIVRGNGQFIAPPVDSQQQTPGKESVGDAVTLDFVNADIRDVVRSVLGDTLRLPYALDPSVQGNVTLQTGGPIPRAAVLSSLEAALRLSGTAIVVRDGLYRVMPTANAARETRLDGSSSSGFTTRIVTPRFVAATDLQRALEPLLHAGSSARADPGRNILILSGSNQDVADILDDVAIFDVDYLRGLSFALLPLKNAQAKDVAREVNSMLAATGGTMTGMVRVIAVNRLNGLLLTAMQPTYLDRVQSWVQRLDQGGADSTNRQLFVYRVQNGRAADLASVLRKTLGIDASSGGGGGSATKSTSSPDASLGGSTGGSDRQPTGGRFSQQYSAPPDVQNPSTSAQADSGADPSSSGADASHGDGLSGVRITADEGNNALLLLATPQEYGIIQSALQQLDILPLQVMIEATIAEVDLTDQLAYGLQYSIDSGRFKAIFSATSSTSPSANAPGFSGIYMPSANSSVVLQALQQVSNVHVLSSPNLLVLNNQSARLQVGDEVPIATQSAVGVLTSGSPVVNSIEYRDTGVILKVTPRVNASGLVLLDISQEVSDVSTTTSSTLDSPTFSQRRVNSSVAVADGQTLALAGLIKENRTVSKNGIPLLQDIPWVGNLFSMHSTSTSRTELIVLITPRVVRDRAAGQAITDELRDKLPLTVPMLSQRKL